jgi:hypothetical protein
LEKRGKKMSVKIELEKKEISIINDSLVYANNRLTEDIKKLKKAKYKLGLNEKESILKDVRKLINFFENLK